MRDRERYTFKDDDLRLIDQVHQVITTHPDRFKDAGIDLDRRFSVDAMIERHRPPMPEAQRQARLEAILQPGWMPNEREVESLAKTLGNRDAAEDMARRFHVGVLSLPSRSEFEPAPMRFSDALRELRAEYLPIETPSPTWDWSSHVMLMFWIIVEPRAEAAEPSLTEFQRWTWDSKDVDDLYPDEVMPTGLSRSHLPFTIYDWPALLNGVRRALRCADRLELVSRPDQKSALVDPSELKDLPLLTASGFAAHTYLLEQSPMAPVSSMALCDALELRGVSVSNDVFRKTCVPKLRLLGLQADRQLGYWYPFGCLARRLDDYESQRIH